MSESACAYNLFGLSVNFVVIKSIDDDDTVDVDDKVVCVSLSMNSSSSSSMSSIRPRPIFDIERANDGR